MVIVALGYWGGQLGVLRVHEHSLSTQVHPLIAKNMPPRKQGKVYKK